LNSNINILKSKAADLGINNFNSPYDLIKFARDILNDHEYLIQKVKYLQQTLDNLEIKFNKKLVDGTENLARDGFENKQASILNKILDKLHPSNVDDIKNSSKNQIECYEKKELINKEEKSDEKEAFYKDENESNKMNCVNSNQIMEINSIESNETMTATEKDDVEIEDNIEDFHLDIESKEKNEFMRSSIDSKKSSIESSDDYRIFSKNS
jgi:hypothetical protein